MSRVFFYGLFMDHTLLANKGLHPRVVGPAMLNVYRIHVGERTTLLPSEVDRAYGILVELGQSEVDALYWEPCVLNSR